MKETIFLIESDSKYFINNRLELAKTLIKSGYKVYVSTFIYNVDNVKTIENEHLIFIKDTNSPFNSTRFILKNVNKIKPGLVHVFTISSIAKIGLLATIMPETKFIYSITGLGYSFISNSFKARAIRLSLHLILPMLTLRNNAKFIVQNSEDYTLISKSYLFSHKNLNLISGSGVNISKYSPSNLSNSTPNVLFAARLLIDKGIREFIEAVNNLSNNNVKANFIVIGEIDSNNPSSISTVEFDTLIKNNKNIDYRGYEKDMPTLLKSTDIVCLPSYREGLSKFLLESAATGIPIITTNVPGCREVVDDMVNGILVKAKNVSELEQALKKLILDSSLRTKMGINSRKKILKEFSSETIIEQIISIYNIGTITKQIQSN